MRRFFILCLFVALCNSANAATRRHHVRSEDVIVHAGRAVIPSFVSPGGTRIYRDDLVPGGLRTDHYFLPANHVLDIALAAANLRRTAARPERGRS